MNALVTDLKKQCVAYLSGSGCFSFHEEYNLISIKPTTNKEIVSSFTKNANITAKEMLRLSAHAAVKKQCTH